MGQGQRPRLIDVLSFSHTDNQGRTLHYCSSFLSGNPEQKFKSDKTNGHKQILCCLRESPVEGSYYGHQREVFVLYDMTTFQKFYTVELRVFFLSFFSFDF